MADWYFRGGPSQSSLQGCPGCRNLVRRGEEFCPFCARRLQERSGWRALAKVFAGQQFAATKILLGLLAAVFLLQMVADFFVPLQLRNNTGGGFSLLTSYAITYFRMGSDLQILVALYHQYWRLLTYTFLHFGLLHILFNGYAFWDLGRLAERLWGGKQVIACFILTGLTGGIASYLWHTRILGSPAHSAGASGAICGILGLLLGTYYRNKYHIGEHLGSHLVRWAVYILLFGLVMGADNAAHIGGMLGGGVLGYFLPPTAATRTPARDGKIWTGLFAASLALLLVCASFAIAYFLRGPGYAVGQLAFR